MSVISTAGHVDHGKSTLVEALTGMHPDRLVEEREREMTIDLGFAWMSFPEIGEIGIVDVPGHRDFIGNMLAGVGNVASVLLVVAADEGIMPQTEEHLAILDLLQVGNGVVALTKTDLVDSSEWVQLVVEEVIQRLEITSLASASVIPVSALEGTGITELMQALTECLSAPHIWLDVSQPRLPVDRVFTVAGFGTVVTGTLLEGRLSIGQEVEIMPGSVRARIRGLQTHKNSLDEAVPGTRVAINLSGVSKDELHRGAVIVQPGSMRDTRMIDVSCRMLSDAHNLIPLRHNENVKLFLGTAEVMARVRGIGARQLLPGENGWLQLELSESVACLRGDRFVLRRPSPGATIAGGVVLDPQPYRRHRLQDSLVLQRLRTLAGGSPADILLQALDTSGVVAFKEAVTKSGLDDWQAVAALKELRIAGDLVVLGKPTSDLVPSSTTIVANRSNWERLSKETHDFVAQYHRLYPLRAGMQREELKSRLGLPIVAFNALMKQLISEGMLVGKGVTLYLPDHQVVFDEGAQQSVNSLISWFHNDLYNTPSRKEAVAMVGEEVLAALLERGTLVAVTDEVLFLTETYAEMEVQVHEKIAVTGSVTVAGVRDLFKTSRKYAIALLENMDKKGITLRKGDERVLR